MTEPRRSFFRGVADLFSGRISSSGKSEDSQRQRGGHGSEGGVTGLAFLRPPGALPEEDFLNTCGACLDCAAACPYDSIQALGMEFGIAQGTPAILPDEAACYLCVDLPCADVCSTGALEVIAREDVRMGLARIDYSTCHQAQGQTCEICVEKCPITGTAITWDERRWPVVIEHGCTGCAVCAVECPADAIVIVPPVSSTNDTA